MPFNDPAAGSTVADTIPRRFQEVENLLKWLFVTTRSPEGSVVADAGSFAVFPGGGTTATFWVKETGSGTSTGWVSK